MCTVHCSLKVPSWTVNIKRWSLMWCKVSVSSEGQCATVSIRWCSEEEALKDTAVNDIFFFYSFKWFYNVEVSTASWCQCRQSFMQYCCPLTVPELATFRLYCYYRYSTSWARVIIYNGEQTIWLGLLHRCPTLLFSRHHAANQNWVLYPDPNEMFNLNTQTNFFYSFFIPLLSNHYGWKCDTMQVIWFTKVIQN